jgi:ectoine hydroxylase-related dioxygenase (phytanoyl-CoA dioxygenase family)
MLTAAQLDELRTRGLTYIRALISPEQAASIEDRIWEFFARRGIDRTDRSTWPPGGLMSNVQGLRQAGVFAPFANDALFDVVDQLLGRNTWAKPRQEGQALISFPQSDPWEVPHKTWHFDLPAKGAVDGFQAVRVFGYAATVEPRGGATLLVEGSHELVRRMVERSPNHNAGQSADVRRRLAGRSAWFKALTTAGGDRVDRFMADGDEVDGVRVRVVEAAGETGDVCLMHPWMLHNIARNCADRPRMMMTQTFLRDDNIYYSK